MGFLSCRKRLTKTTESTNSASPRIYFRGLLALQGTLYYVPGELHSKQVAVIPSVAEKLFCGKE